MNYLKTLFEKYNFDFIYINPKNINNIDFLYDAEMLVIDNVSENYVGEVKINDKKVRVYYDKKITPGDVIFKYKDIKKERKVKLFSIINNSVD